MSTLIAEPNYANLFNYWLSFFGSLCSIVGFVITILVWRGIRNLKEAYVFKATAPQRIQELEKIRATSQELLAGNFSNENKRLITENLISAKINCQNLSPKLERINKKDYRSGIHPKLKQFEQAYEIYENTQDKNSARGALNILFEFIKAAKFLLEDEDWRQIE